MYPPPRGVGGDPIHIATIHLRTLCDHGMVQADRWKLKKVSQELKGVPHGGDPLQTVPWEPHGVPDVLFAGFCPSIHKPSAPQAQGGLSFRYSPRPSHLVPPVTSHHSTQKGHRFCRATVIDRCDHSLRGAATWVAAVLGLKLSPKTRLADVA